MSTIAPKAPNPSASSRSNGPRRICVAYSGGLDTSCVIPWLREHYKCEVVAFVADVGQGKDELIGIEKKAKDSGACECYVADLREKFLTDFVWPMVMAGCTYEGRYLLGTSIARPCIAEAHVKAALETNCDAVAHGCTGKGNDQVRFESTFAALAPQLKVIAPWRETAWELRSREAMLAYLDARKIPCAASATKIYSRDANLWHISHEGGALEDPWNAPPEDVWMRTTNPVSAPNEPEEVIVGFEHGVPVSVNGTKLGPVALLEKLNELAGKHGVGRVDLVENRLVGMKSRGVYETPGGTILMEALRGIEQLVLDRDSMHYREQLAIDYARVIYDGRWFCPLRESLQSAILSLAKPLTGETGVRLYKGTATASRRRSPNSLYSHAFATFGEDEVYDQRHAEGFIRLFSLPSRIRAMLGLGPKVQVSGVQVKGGAAR
jgi:argininosuccinate synthase